MINLITGIPGSGKTLYLAKLVQQMLKNGEEVWSYFKCRFNDSRVKYFREIEEIQHIKNANIILDEAQIWFNAREWDKFPKALQYALQLNRHHGVDMWGATQDISQIEKQYRDKIQNFYEVYKVFGTEIRKNKMPKHPWGVFALRKMSPSEVKLAESHRKILGYKVFFADKKLFDFYDTLADYELEKEVFTYYVKVNVCSVCKHKEVNWKDIIYPARLKQQILSEVISDTKKLPF
jgi:hypothetical protein